MATLLQINSSLFSADGQSSQLANAFIELWLAAKPDTQIARRDLAANPLPHLDAQRVAAYFAQPDARTAEQQLFVAESDALIDELKQADVIVIGLPMYNFGIP